MYNHLNYLIAHQRADELRRAGESERLARSIHADRRAPALAQRIARVAAALRPQLTLAASERG
jgi:hypothetical protein